MARHDEEEVPGASDNIEDAEDLETLRRSVRQVQPTWKRKEALDPPSSSGHRQKRVKTSSQLQLSQQNKYTPPPSQASASKVLSTPPETQTSEPSTSQREKVSNKQKPDWEKTYTKLKAKSKASARDFLVEKIGKEAFNDPLNIPYRAPKVAFEEEVTLEDPLSIWLKFIPQQELDIIARHTNQNYNKWVFDSNYQFKPEERRWRELTGLDIGAYFGALFLLGCQGATGSVADNWSTSEDSPTYPLQKECPLKHFQQIERFLKVNSPYEELSDEDFWKKVDPLVTTFRQACRKNIIPGSDFSIDEQLRLLKGRWKHSIQIANKADSKGAKFYSLCTGYYCIDLLFASKVVQVPEATEFECELSTGDFTATENVVLSLLDRLRKDYPECLQHRLATDNFFTTRKLCAELRLWNTGMYGTAKRGSGIPKEHVLLRDVTSKEKDYGLEVNSVIQGVNCFTFVDQKATFMMSTLHDTLNQPPKWRGIETRPTAATVYAEVDSQGNTVLPYPQLSYDYNHGMNGSDLASQVWSYYSVAKYSHWRNWLPLLFLILDASIANVLAIYRLKGFSDRDITHKALQERIALQLLRNPAAVLRKRQSRVAVIGQRPSDTQRPPNEHSWIQPGKRSYCFQCKPHSDNPVGRPRNKDRQPLQEIDTNIPSKKRGKSTSFKCKECDIWLCLSSQCWQRHHEALEERERCLQDDS